MKSDRRLPVAIVGGGASGTILAAQLARRGIGSLLIDGTGRAGRGVAYSTKEPAHLLNVRAEVMSAWSGAPDDFANWFEALGGGRRDYAERRLFGRYLCEVLRDAGGCATLVNATAVRAEQDGCWRVHFDDGSQAQASALVLATGNQEPEPLRAFASVGARLIANPWSGEAQAAVREVAESGADVLSIGTGLTMVDLALSLDAAGHRGQLLAVSRRGLIPRAHADYEPAPVELAHVPRGNLRAIAGWLRKRSAEVGFRAAVDSLRPHTHPLWQSLDGDQHRRFLRHARPWWDVHRHRIAPQVGQTVQRMIAEGRLQVAAGRIADARDTGAAVEVTIRRRGTSQAQTFTAAYVFNCTGRCMRSAGPRSAASEPARRARGPA
jgi:uncharacterized NAD(P)/FAD-binding protein YdhS